MAVEVSTRRSWRWLRRSDPWSKSGDHTNWPKEPDLGRGIDASSLGAAPGHEWAKELRTDCLSANSLEGRCLVKTHKPLSKRCPPQLDCNENDSDCSLRLSQPPNLSGVSTDWVISDRVRACCASRLVPDQRLSPSMLRYVRIPF